MIGDEDTCTGFLLGGIGEINKARNPNFLVVDKNTSVGEIDECFKGFLQREDVAIILINQVSITTAFLLHCYCIATALLLSVLELQMVERSKELDQRNGHESRPSGCSYSVFCACFKGASLCPSHAQNVAELIRPSLDAHVNPIPTVLEIPSKDHPYDASKDSILRRAKGMFSAEDMK